MKAVRIHEDGGPEVLRYEEVPAHVAQKIIEETQREREAAKA